MKPFATEAGLALLFGVLYLIIFVHLIHLYRTRQIKLRSRYTFVFFHVFIRVTSQGCAMAFALVGWEDPGRDLLVAYLVLGAEGYFSLILTTYRFMISWDETRHGVSSLEPTIPNGTPRWTALRMLLTSRMSAVDMALGGANALIVAGGALISGQSRPEELLPDAGKIATGRIMRAVGGGIFLGLVQLLVWLLLRRWKGGPRDTMLVLLLATWPFLSIRGVFGILQALPGKYDYYNERNYNSHGFSTSFLTGEYVLGTTTEWVSCALLMTTWFSPEERRARQQLRASKDAEEAEELQSVSA